MNLLRSFVDRWYDRNRDRIFAETESDPEIAHERFLRAARIITGLKLERLLLNCSENQRQRFIISNAAGFNKNGTIPPTFLNYLGFDRVVVGTVTGDSWNGNPKPMKNPARIKRYPDTMSMVNWLGLPGFGAERVAEILYGYGNHRVPLTINFMSTPGKTGEAQLEDLEKTVKSIRDLPYVYTWQLNISCPNTGESREHYQSRLDSLLGTVEPLIHRGQSLELKVSPDLDLNEVKEIIDVSREHPEVLGFVTTNTTTHHGIDYINPSPGRGGASGDAVYSKAFEVQKMFSEIIKKENLPYFLKACGGISSRNKALQRMDHYKVIGIELFTPLIFVGPKLLREIRS